MYRVYILPGVGYVCGSRGDELGLGLALYNPLLNLIGMTTTSTTPGKPPATTTTGGPITTTTPGNGVVTRSPTQVGMAPNCNKFVLVKQGDGFCDDMAKRAGISTADFYKWNTVVGSNCQDLWLDTYYCVGLIRTAPTVPPAFTPTTNGNGVSTPTPIQDGMVSNCRRFHFVVSGDSCAKLAKQYSITESDFYKWNLAVNDGGTCKALWLETFVCVGL